MSLRLHTGVIFDHVIGRLLPLNLTNGQGQEMVALEFSLIMIHPLRSIKYHRFAEPDLLQSLRHAQWILSTPAVPQSRAKAVGHESTQLMKPKPRRMWDGSEQHGVLSRLHSVKRCMPAPTSPCYRFHLGKAPNGPHIQRLPFVGQPVRCAGCQVQIQLRPFEPDNRRDGFGALASSSQSILSTRDYMGLQPSRH